MNVCNDSLESRGREKHLRVFPGILAQSSFCCTLLVVVMYTTAWRTLGRESLFSCLPIDNVPDRREVLSFPVLVLQVVLYIISINMKCD